MLEFLAIPKVQEYRSMYKCVAKTYMRILLSFSPYLVGFSGCFMVMNNNPEIASGFSKSIMYTLQMMIGEVNFAEMKFDEICNSTTVLNSTECTKDFKRPAKYMGYTLFLAFLFLVVIVLMNLLNAIAIGDVQELRTSSVEEYNKARIMSLLDQDPQLRDVCYQFDYVNLPSKSKAKWPWTLTHLDYKVTIPISSRVGGFFEVSWLNLDLNIRKKISLRFQKAGNYYKTMHLTVSGKIWQSRPGWQKIQHA